MTAQSATGTTVAETNLKPGALRLPSIFMQSLTMVAPGIAALFYTPVVVAQAGLAAPLAYPIAFVIVLLTAIVLAQLARAVPGAGGYYNYVSRGINPTRRVPRVVAEPHLRPARPRRGDRLRRLRPRQLARLDRARLVDWFPIGVRRRDRHDRGDHPVPGRPAVGQDAGHHRRDRADRRLPCSACGASPIRDPAGSTSSRSTPATRRASRACSSPPSSPSRPSPAGKARRRWPRSPRTRPRTCPRALIGSVILFGIFIVIVQWGVMIGWGTDHYKDHRPSRPSCRASSLAKQFWGDFWGILLVMLISSVIAVSIACANVSHPDVVPDGRGRSLPEVVRGGPSDPQDPGQRDHRPVGPGDRDGDRADGIAALFTPVPEGARRPSRSTRSTRTSTTSMATCIGYVVLIIYTMGNIAAYMLYRRERKSEFNWVLHGLFPLLSTLGMVARPAVLAEHLRGEPRVPARQGDAPAGAVQHPGRLRRGLVPDRRSSWSSTCARPVTPTGCRRQPTAPPNDRPPRRRSRPSRASGDRHRLTVRTDDDPTAARDRHVTGDGLLSRRGPDPQPAAAAHPPSPRPHERQRHDEPVGHGLVPCTSSSAGSAGSTRWPASGSSPSATGSAGAFACSSSGPGPGSPSTSSSTARSTSGGASSAAGRWPGSPTRGPSGRGSTRTRTGAGSAPGAAGWS